jgi:hypothetical protein
MEDLASKQARKIKVQVGDDVAQDSHRLFQNGDLQLQEVERRHALPRQRAPRETALCERALQADSSLCGSLFSSGRAQSSRCHTRPCPGSTGRCQGNRSWGSCRCPQGRVLARHRHARGVGYADDSYFYAQLKAALKVLVEIRQRPGEDSTLSFNMGKVKICIPGVTRERARELVLRHIDQDSSLENLRELGEKDLAAPELGIINVTGLTCAGVPIGTPEFANACVRSKAHAIEQDVQKLHIVRDPKLHCDLLHFSQHTRLAFLARNVPPDVMMRPADVNFDPGRGDWGSGILQRSSIVPVPVLIQDSIVQAILQHGPGATFDTLSAHELEWCRAIVELPHHQGGLGITHYAFASIGNGSFLQRDCSHGFLAGFAPSCLRMGCL